MEERFADHPLGHGSRFGLSARARARDATIRISGLVKAPLAGQASADDIVHLELLIEFGKLSSDLTRSFQGFVPMLLLHKNLRLTQRDHGQPRVLTPLGF